jgi:hypothetical protein
VDSGLPEDQLSYLGEALESAGVTLNEQGVADPDNIELALSVLGQLYVQARSSALSQQFGDMGGHSSTGPTIE